MKRQSDAGDFSAQAGSQGPLFRQPVEGPFSRSKLQPSSFEVMIAGMIWKHQGRENPISIARLRELTYMDERAIKAVVASLIQDHKMRIGARRDKPSGYFVIRDAEDARVGTSAYKGQFIDMARRLRVLDPDGMPELYGQLQLEVEG